jgi:hypothetical protein
VFLICCSCVAGKQVEEKVDFAGQQVKITKEVEIGSKEHAALQVFYMYAYICDMYLKKHICVFMYVCMHACMHVGMYACLYVCVCVFVYVCTIMYHIYIYIYIYIV